MRLLASSAFALAFLLPALALADVPASDGGTTSTSTGEGGGAAANNPSCNVSTQSINGTSCAECEIESEDTNCAVELGADYNYVCTQSEKVQIWCNGPNRRALNEPSCALGGAPLPASAAGLAGLIGLVALGFGRRRR
jgi:MYXO-CTERM domain-containing protein